MSDDKAKWRTAMTDLARCSFARQTCGKGESTQTSTHNKHAKWSVINFIFLQSVGGNVRDCGFEEGID